MNDHQRRSVSALLVASPVLGVEVDIRYRVLAVTIEPSPELHPSGDVPDRRVQVVVHPVGTIMAAMVDTSGETATVLQFDETQLADVANAFADTTSTVQPFPDELPDPDELGDRLSMFGSAQTGDGTACAFHLRLEDPDAALVLDLWASFDELELRDPAGGALEPRRRP